MICGVLSPASVPGLGASELAVTYFSALFKAAARVSEFHVKQG